MAAVHPARERLAEPFFPGRVRVAAALRDGVLEGLPDGFVGRLAGVPGAEVEGLDAARFELLAALVEAQERVGALALEDGVQEQGRRLFGRPGFLC